MLMHVYVYMLIYVRIMYVLYTVVLVLLESEFILYEMIRYFSACPLLHTKESLLQSIWL